MQKNLIWFLSHSTFIVCSLAFNVCSAGDSMRCVYFVVASRINFCSLLLSNRNESSAPYWTTSNNNYERKKTNSNCRAWTNKGSGDGLFTPRCNAHWHSHDVISNDDYAVSSSATCPFRYQEVSTACQKLGFIREKDLRKKWDEKRILQQNKQYKIHDICLQIVRAAKCNVSEYVCVSCG